MSKESWYAGKLSDMDAVTILNTDDWVVNYDKSRSMYRVSHFEDNHFKDECWFDAYEDKECKQFSYWYKEEKGCIIRCFNCKKRLDLRYPDGTEVQYLDYCPNCGSEMAGERVAYKNNKEK